MSILFFTDACCSSYNNIGSWAVVTPDRCYSGLISGYECNDGLSVGYCELVAVEQAIRLARNNDVLIYCDNKGVVSRLNKIDVNSNFGKTSYNVLMKRVHYMYNNMNNVKVRKISRKDNRTADKLARETMKEW